MIFGLESSSLSESLFYIIVGLVIFLDIVVLIFILKRLVFSENAEEKVLIARSENAAKRKTKGVKETNASPKIIRKEVVKEVVKEVMDEETKRVLKIADELLGKLPEDVVEDFTKSQDFKLYKRVMERALK